MPRSFYKGEWLGKLPACAICVGRGHGPPLLHLPLGVSVWLCAAHRDPEWLASQAGRDLVVSLQTVWGAANCLTARRSRALSLFQAPLRSAHRARRLPGSYSWRQLRREAEGRFAAGEPPSAVIDELRRRELNRPGPAHPPWVQTMRRWFRDGRWRGAGGGPCPGSEEPRLPDLGGGTQPQMPIRPRRGDTPPRGPLQQPLLEEVRLVDVLDRVGSSPTLAARVPSPTGPPSNFSTIVRRIWRSIGSRPSASTSRSASASSAIARSTPRRPGPGRSPEPVGAGGWRSAASPASVRAGSRRRRRRCGTSSRRADRWRIAASSVGRSSSAGGGRRTGRAAAW